MVHVIQVLHIMFLLFGDSTTDHMCFESRDTCHIFLKQCFHITVVSESQFQDPEQEKPKSEICEQDHDTMFNTRCDKFMYLAHSLSSK